MNGSGRLLGNNGVCVYDGAWTVRRVRRSTGGMTLDVLYDGFGRLLADGEVVYEGTWTMGLRHGPGRQSFPDGTSYDGQWVRGRRVGTGRFLVDSRCVFEGLFDQHPVRGTLYDHGADGRQIPVYVGGVTAAVDDDGRMCVHRHGAGTELCRHTGRRVYEGEFRADVRDGVGKEFDERDRTIFTGRYARGARNGSGTLWHDHDRSAAACEGEWRDDVLHGDVTEYAADGRVTFQGRYEAGMRQDVGSRKRAREDDVARASARQRVASLCAESEHLRELPACPFCLGDMMEGDEIYAYTTCGHRVCSCFTSRGVDARWKTTCPTCRVASQGTVRLW